MPCLPLAKWHIWHRRLEFHQSFKMKKENIPECCKGCSKFDQFGKDCWVYWENKKECSQHSSQMNGFNL